MWRTYKHGVDGEEAVVEYSCMYVHDFKTMI